jgi:hypothetical protein
MLLNEQIGRMRVMMGLNESKQTEQQSMNILAKAGVEDANEILPKFISGDKSNNQKNLPVMAFLYANGYKDVNNIVNITNKYDDLVTKQRVKPIQITRNGLVMGDKTFTDFLKFSEYIDGEANKYADQNKQSSSVAADFSAEDKPMWSGNNIDIYEGDDVGKCIKYTSGQLTGRGYSFCIGQPGNTMYQSYRDIKDSSFYFIVDKNRFKKDEKGNVNLDDPLHIVVFDATIGGVELTDANNKTGNIAEYGNNPSGYIQYLKSKGVPVDKLVNRPKTDQEEEEDELLGQQKSSLEWFIKLPYEYKSKYIGRGHALTNDQFDYLIGS